MSWSYRICRSEIKKEGQPGYHIKYSIKEVYNKPNRHTVEDMTPVVFLDEDGEENTEAKCIESIREQLVRMLLDTTRPVYRIK